MTKEDRLRKQIKEILEHDPTIIRVDDRCSGIEFGIDLVFERRDVFGVPREYGIQIKTKNIKSTKDRHSISVKEIIAQLAIAFGHSFPPDGKHLDAVYIVTDKEINMFAQEDILAARVGFREIHFIDKQYLNRFLIEGKAKVSVLKKK
jgi:hypothetical protein